MPLLGPVETEPATTGIANLVPCISPQVNLINTGLTDSAIDRLDVRLTERGIVNPGSEHSPLHPVQLRSAPGWCYTGPVCVRRRSGQLDENGRPEVCHLGTRRV